MSVEKRVNIGKTHTNPTEKPTEVRKYHAGGHDYITVWAEMSAIPENLDKIPLTVRVIVVYGRSKILIIRRSERDQWEIPGGGVKDNEPPVRAAIRELEEETSMQATGYEEMGTASTYDLKYQLLGITLFYLAYLDQPLGNPAMHPDPDTGINWTIKWIPMRELPDYIDWGPISHKLVEKIMQSVGIDDAPSFAQTEDL